MRPATRCYLCRKRVLRQFCVLERSKRGHLVHICPSCMRDALSQKPTKLGCPVSPLPGSSL